MHYNAIPILSSNIHIPYCGTFPCKNRITFSQYDNNRTPRTSLCHRAMEVRSRNYLMQYLGFPYPEKPCIRIYMMYTFPTQEHAYSYHKKNKNFIRGILKYTMLTCASLWPA